MPDIIMNHYSGLQKKESETLNISLHPISINIELNIHKFYSYRLWIVLDLFEHRSVKYLWVEHRETHKNR